MTATVNTEDDSQRTTAEILRLAEAIRNGRLDERGNLAGLADHSATMIGAVNRMLDGLVGPLRLASRALDQIAHGSIPEFVTEDYRGGVQFNQEERKHVPGHNVRDAP